MEINCNSNREDKYQNKEFPTKETLNQKNSMRKEMGDVISKSHTVKRTQGNPVAQQKSKIDEVIDNFSEEDLKKLCDRISIVNDSIKTSSVFLKIRYDLPQHMLERLDEEALELESLYKELVRASKHVETIRNQRQAVAKERLDLESQISRLKADVLSELEVIVSVYDADMLGRWHAVKSTDSKSQVENFLHDVKGKLEAMKNLQTLATHMIVKMTDELKEETKKEKKRKNEEERQNNLGNNFFERRDSESLPIPLHLPLLDSDSEGLLEDGNVHNVLYNLVYGEILNLPAWAQDTFDIVDVD